MATVLGRSGVMGSSSFLTGWGGFVAATGKEAIRCWSSCFSSFGGPLGSFGLMKGRWRWRGQCWQRGGGGDDRWHRGGGLLLSSAAEEGVRGVHPTMESLYNVRDGQNTHRG
jgi:hypothetical protein